MSSSVHDSGYIKINDKLIAVPSQSSLTLKQGKVFIGDREVNIPISDKKINFELHNCRIEQIYLDFSECVTISGSEIKNIEFTCEHLNIYGAFEGTQVVSSDCLKCKSKKTDDISSQCVDDVTTDGIHLIRSAKRVRR